MKSKKPDSKAPAGAVVDHIGQLLADPANRRKHNARNIGMVVDALQQVGAARSIVIDENNVIMAGNGVTEAAAEAGITKVRVIDAEGDELIAVRRSGLTDDQKRKLAIYDNRSGELASWDVEQLKKDAADGLDLASFFFTDELDALFAGSETAAGKTDPDAVPDVRATDIQLGDMFELGRHRILCGDSTKADDVARVLASDSPLLMVTDPPYGVSYDPSWRMKAGLSKGSQRMGKVLNDDQADWTEVWRLFKGPVAYVWHGGLKSSTVQASLELAGFAVRSQIVWAKDRLVISRGDYHWQHEPCWYAVREGGKGHRTGDRLPSTLWRIAVPAPATVEESSDVSTVWEIASRDGVGHTHGTQKPVECMARPIRNHRAPSVFEPFSGSGTTIMAAETLSRACFAIELFPSYVQVAIDRWEAFTGKKATKVASR